MIIADTFGVGNTFDVTAAYNVSGPSAVLPVSGMFENDVASEFKSPTSVFLEAVDVAIANFSGNTAVDVRIAPDAGGLPGTTWLEQVQVSAPASVSVVHVDFSGALLLNAGVSYWLWLSAPDDGSSGWFHNSEVFSDLAAALDPGIDGGGSWSGVNQDSPAFRVLGKAAVPESGSTLLMLGMVVSGLVLRRRRS